MKIVLPYSAHKGFDVNSTKMVGGIEKFINCTDVDELMIAGQIFDHQTRIRSYEIVSEIFIKREK